MEKNSVRFQNIYFFTVYGDRSAAKENTLIRVAVDLLMNQSSELKGTTEQELGASVGLD